MCENKAVRIISKSICLVLVILVTYYACNTHYTNKWTQDWKSESFRSQCLRDAGNLGDCPVNAVLKEEFSIAILIIVAILTILSIVGEFFTKPIPPEVEENQIQIQNPQNVQNLENQNQQNIPLENPNYRQQQDLLIQQQQQRFQEELAIRQAQFHYYDYDGNVNRSRTNPDKRTNIIKKIVR
jgi:hypothetical protein